MHRNGIRIHRRVNVTSQSAVMLVDVEGISELDVWKMRCQWEHRKFANVYLGSMDPNEIKD